MGCQGLAERLVRAAAQPLPEEVAAVARRMLLNVSAAAFAGSRHEVVGQILTLAAKHGGKPVAPVVGRAERVDPYFAALCAGVAARALDVDDVHSATRMYPSAAPFGTLVALAATKEFSGARMLTAFSLGCETAIRLAIAISPNHYEVGWEATGTCGVIGAAVTGALLLGADSQGMTYAMGTALGQTVGMREALGTPSGLLHAGKAATAGWIAARLGPRGFTSTPSLDEEPFHFFTAFRAEQSKIDAVAADIGSRWRILETEARPGAVAPSAALARAVQEIESAASSAAFLSALAA